MTRRAPGRSLRFRLLAGTLLALLVALGLAGALLSGLFREHVTRQFERALTAQLDQVTARLEWDAGGRPQLDAAALSDPRWTRPYSGLYWQVDEAGAALRHGVLRSRSLWDTTLRPPADTPADGEVHVHELAGPDGARLLAVERTVASGAAPGAWRLVVAGDLRDTAAAIAGFDGVLAASLAALLVLLAAAAVAQVAVGLAPLEALQRALAAVHGGRAARLDGTFPAEVQPLVDDFNRVLDRNAEVVQRARTQAGNLAHAIKTPLAALAQAADVGARDPAAAAALPALVGEQVTLARRHVDWHLARARAAAAHALPGARTPVGPVLEGLVRVMQRVHAGRSLAIRIEPVEPALTFAGEQQDLQEMAGNVIDNACKWARGEVRIAAAEVVRDGAPRLELVVEDDGPGIAPERIERALARGARLDESVPGSGLGLAIVEELAALYGGCLQLGRAAPGGLQVTIELPGGLSARRA